MDTRVLLPIPWHFDDKFAALSRERPGAICRAMEDAKLLLPFVIPFHTSGNVIRGLLVVSH
jgi:hypothetical protein